MCGAVQHSTKLRREEYRGTLRQSFLPSLFTVALLCAAAAQGATAASEQSPPQPQAQIDLSAIGFRGLSASARLQSQANISVDFADDNHVLVTFNPKKMFKRLPDCPATHEDRLIHAVILSVPDGKVVRETDWYMHDQQRYLWPLASGHFLVRRLNSLYSVDSELHEKLLIASPKPFLWISVTPDGKQIIAERAQDEAAPAKAKSQNKSKKPNVKIEFLDSETLAVQRVIKAEGIVNLEAQSTGFADVIHSKIGRVWLVRFGPSGSQREYVTRVRSRCVPDVVFSSANTLLVGRCAMTGSDYSVSAFTLSGHFLWRQHWSQQRYLPKLLRSEDGSRVAVSSVARVIVDPQVSGDEAGDQPDRGLKQSILVLDTASGTQALSLEADPAVLTAQNVSLSPDGRRLVVLQSASLAVYELPEMSAEERAKYIAVKADVPGLYTVAGQPTPTGAEPEETTFASVDAAEETGGSDAEAKQENSSAAPSSSDPKAPPATSPAPATSSQGETSSGGTDTPALTLKTTARIVVEDVVVTDAKGRPVKGLRAEDFQLAEDGKPQNVRAFEEYPKVENAADSQKAVASATSASPSAAPPSSTPQAPPKLAPNVYTNSAAKGPDTGSATIVVLDLLNTPLPDQQRARDQLISFIKKRPEASQMALCALSTNLRLIQGFTHDDNALIAAVNGKKGGVKAPPWQSDAGLQKSVQMARDVALVAGTQQSIVALQRAQNLVDEQNAHDIDTRMRFTMDAFMQLARYLSGVPGRKNLVWLSGSFPLSISPNPDVTDFQPVTRNYEGEIKKVTNLLAEAHVAVYPVSLEGVETQSMFQAANSGTYEPRAFAGSQGPNRPGTASQLANTSASLPMSSRMDQETRTFRDTVASSHSTMDEVAADTGGKAIYSSNNVEDAIRAAVDEGSHYYTLSYTPTNKKYDGAFRKIRVSLEQKGYHLAYRRGYYAVDPEAGARDTRAPAQRIGVAAMQQGAPQSRQVVFATRVVPIGKPHKVDAVQAGPAARPAKKKGVPAGPVEMQHYGIDYAVDPSDLRFTQTAGGLYHAVLAFMVTAFNDDSRLVASLASTATSDLKPANYRDVMTGGFRLHQELDVPTEAVSLRIGVEDTTSSRVGTMEIALPVPVPPETPQVATRTLPPIEPD